jgi:predicted esterase YcpF (UPF0227 family)
MSTVQSQSAASANVYDPTPVSENTWWGELRGRNDDVILNPNLEPDRARGFADAATLAIDAYEDSDAPDGFTRVSDADLRALGLDPSLFSDASTGFQAVLYQNNETGEYTLAFRGTDEATDWVESNIPAATGERPESYEQALAVTEAVIGAVGDEGLTLTGHSLGGGLANYAGVYFDLDFTIFNAAGLSETLIDDLEERGPYHGTGTVINDQHDPLTNHTGRFNDESYGGRHYGHDEIIWVENQQFSDVALNPSDRLDAHSVDSNILPYLAQESRRESSAQATSVAKLAQDFLKL